MHLTVLVNNNGLGLTRPADSPVREPIRNERKIRRAKKAGPRVSETMEFSAVKQQSFRSANAIQVVQRAVQVGQLIISPAITRQGIFSFPLRGSGSIF